MQVKIILDMSVFTGLHEKLECSIIYCFLKMCRLATKFGYVFNEELHFIGRALIVSRIDFNEDIKLRMYYHLIHECLNKL